MEDELDNSRLRALQFLNKINLYYFGHTDKLFLKKIFKFYLKIG